MLTTSCSNFTAPVKVNVTSNKDQNMQSRKLLLGIAAALAITTAADAQIVRGIMTVTGAEMH